MYLLNAEQMSSIDKSATEKYGLESRTLMGFAGFAAARIIKERFQVSNSCGVVCGSGNNGGDGFVIAALLNNYGFNVVVYFDKQQISKLSDESLYYYSICHATGIIQNDITCIKNCKLIVDALFGIGFQGPLRQESVALVEYINELSAHTIAVDIPSGLPASGIVYNHVVRAELTISFGYAKVNHYTRQANEYCGEVVIADIGLPVSLVETVHNKIELIDDTTSIAPLLTPKSNQINKTLNGRVAICGGFSGMEGALIMALDALLECGNGMSYAVLSHNSSLQGRNLPNEVITYRLQDDILINQIKTIIMKIDTLVIGPGLGRGDFSRTVFLSILEQLMIDPVRFLVLDADALFFIADETMSQLLLKLPDSIQLIITPHATEAARLLKITAVDVDNNSVASARQLAAKYNAICLVKGSATIISSPLRTTINGSGNELLATAGSGDILTGIIASFLSKCYDPFDAVAIAVYVHGRTADISRDTTMGTGYAFKATDILTNLRPALLTYLRA